MAKLLLACTLITSSTLGMEILLHYGANKYPSHTATTTITDIDTRNRLWFTALHRATLHCQPDTIALLLAENHDIEAIIHKTYNVPNHKFTSHEILILLGTSMGKSVLQLTGMTPLQLAAAYAPRKSAVRMLLAAGANIGRLINHQDTQQPTISPPTILRCSQPTERVKIRTL